jgi:hypothetical protein
MIPFFFTMPIQQDDTDDADHVERHAKQHQGQQGAKTSGG